jgi:hypothetical protein
MISPCSWDWLSLTQLFDERLLNENSEILDFYKIYRLFIRMYIDCDALYEKQINYNKVNNMIE